MMELSNHSNWMTYSHLDPQNCFNFRLRPRDDVDAKLLHQKEPKNPEIAPPVLGISMAGLCPHLRWLMVRVQYTRSWKS